MTDDFHLFNAAGAGDDVDPDIALVATYLARELSVAQIVAVQERLETDSVFRAKVQPLIDGWSLPGSWGSMGDDRASAAPTPAPTLSRAGAQWTRGVSRPAHGRRISTIRVAAAIGVIMLPMVGFAGALRYALRQHDVAGRQPMESMGPATVGSRTPPLIDTSAQTLSFPAPGALALGALRFVDGPTGDQSLIRQALSRAQAPQSSPFPLVNAGPLQVVGPLPYHNLALPRRLGAPDASLADAKNSVCTRLTCWPLFLYLVRGADRSVATIGLATDTVGLFVAWMGNGIPLVRGSSWPGAPSHDASEPLFRALQRVAALEPVRTGDYEPRLVQLDGVRGTQPMVVLWLHSSSEKPDLFYWPRDPEFSGKTNVQQEKLYVAAEMLAAARLLPVTPEHDEAWAIATATACADATGRSISQPWPLQREKAEVEIGLSDRQDRIVWYVFIPAAVPAGVGAFMNPRPGAGYLVDEANGSCQPVGGG